jgi:hypothetical protein
MLMDADESLRSTAWSQTAGAEVERRSAVRKAGTWKRLAMAIDPCLMREYNEPREGSSWKRRPSRAHCRQTVTIQSSGVF